MRHITIPKLGTVHFKDSGVLQAMFSRNCETRIGTVTVSRDACGDFYASFQIGFVCPFKSSPGNTGLSVGIDVNVKNFYTDSDGNVIDNPEYLSMTSGSKVRQSDACIRTGVLQTCKT